MLQTASEVVSFAVELEKEAAAFYSELSTRGQDWSEVFLPYRDRSLKLSRQILNTYQGGISDVLEAGFAFGIQPQAFVIRLTTQDLARVADAAKRAQAIEQTLASFFMQGAEQAGVLMTDIQRLFTRLAREHRDRHDAMAHLAQESR